VEEETELSVDDLDRAKRLIPPEKLSRYLSRLGKTREFLDALEEPFGKEMLTRINADMLVLENQILTAVEGGLTVQKARIRYDVRKEDADWVLSRFRQYADDVKAIRKAGEERR